MPRALTSHKDSRLIVSLQIVPSLFSHILSKILKMITVINYDVQGIIGFWFAGNSHENHSNNRPASFLHS